MTATGYLALRMLLTETAVLRNGFTPLHVESEPVIPGRVQRGMLAAALKRSGREDVEDLIDQWVAKGEAVRFGPALPFVESSPGHGIAAVPTPATLHYLPAEEGGDQESYKLVDLLGVQEKLAGRATPGGIEPGKRLRGFVLPPDLLTPVKVATHTEQYLGTGRAGEPLQGVPFLTTMLDAGQVFEARWQLGAETQSALQALAKKVLEVLEKASGTLVLGTGSTRAHGGRPQITRGADTLLVSDRIHRPEEPGWSAGEVRDLVLLAPALVVDDYGEPRPGHLPQAVDVLCSQVLGEGAVTRVGAVVESEPVEAYHRMYRSAMASRWAAAAGSVVRLRARRTITAGEVRALEGRAMGQRQVDGHGCFVLLKPASQVKGTTLRAAESIRPAAELRLPDGTVPRVVGPPADAPDPGAEVASLQNRMLTDAVAEPLRARARDLAGRAEQLPSPSLLGRLREVEAKPSKNSEDHRRVLADLAAVAAGDKDSSAKDRHKVFTDKAKEAAAKCLIHSGDHKRNLTYWLREAAAAAGASDGQNPWWTAFASERDLIKAIMPVDLHPAEGADPLSGAARTWLNENRPWMIRLLVGTWLAEAARRGRTEADRKEQQQ